METASTNGSCSLPVDLYGISHSYQGNDWFSVQRTTRVNYLQTMGVKSFKEVFWVMTLRSLLLFFCLVCLFFILHVNILYSWGLKTLMYFQGFKYHPWYFGAQLHFNAPSGVVTILFLFYFLEVILRCHSLKKKINIWSKN